MDDYIDFILGRNQPKNERGGKPKGPRNTSADMRAARSELSKADAAIARLSAEVEQLDQQILAMSEGAGGETGLAMQRLLKKRAEASDALAEAEEAWLAASAALEAADAA